IVPSLAPSMRNEAFGGDDALLPSPDELLPADEGLVPRVGAGNFHAIRRIGSTNLVQPCQSGSAAGSPYFCSYSRTVLSTSSRVMFSWLMPRPNTLPPPALPAKNCNPSISSSTVGIGHETTSLRKLRVFRAGACIIRI